MHRISNKFNLRRFQLSSLLVLLLWLTWPLVLPVFAYGIFNVDQEILKIGVYIAGGYVVLFLFVFILTTKAKCPLCTMPPLQNRGCMKHRNVVRFLGSHRLYVAGSILFKGSFRCPYCGEPTKMKVRSARRR